MNKKFIIFSCLIAVVILFSACFGVPSGPNNNNKDSSNSQTQEESTLTPTVSWNEGTHLFKAEKTDDFIVKNSETSYKIVISQNAGSVVRTAANELIDLLFESTGILFEIIDDQNVTFSESSKYLVLGTNALSESANIVYDYATLKSQGYRIKTVGKSVFMGGSGSYGTLYSVYGFLQHTVNYDYFYTDSWQVDKNLKQIPLYNYDVTEVPDIEYRDATYGYVTASNQVSNRYRMMTRDTFIIPIGGGIGHNALGWFGKDENLKTHKDWFNDPVKPTQPCYTAHGNAEEWQLMVEYAVNNLKQALMLDREKEVVLFCCEDNSDTCNCEPCKLKKAQYGSDSGAMLEVINAIKRGIDEWFNGEGSEYKRELTISFYAYLGYEQAPSGGIVCEEGVVPYIALIHADYMVSLLHEDNKSSYGMVEEWKAISNDIHFYYYDTNYSYYFTPYNTFDSMQDNYKYAAVSGSSCMHNLGQPNQTGISTGFSTLKVYLQSKLGWNVNSDLNVYTDKFFKGYFDVASESMRKYFDEYRLHAVIQHDLLGYNGYNTIYRNPLTRELWPKNLLERWIGYVDQAMESISIYEESNPKLYKALYGHISAERINLYYLYVELYGTDASETVIASYKKAVKNDANSLGLKYFKENTTNGPITILWSSWKV
ncbi:MAG: DUF4838 domain-containing protein [Clostridia bacterium]|nr:DUF4838 domain-containing protein [Clostridia bacterium]